MKRLELIRSLKEIKGLDVCAPVYGRTIRGEQRLLGYVYLDKKDLLETLEDATYYTDIFLDDINRNSMPNWYLEREDHEDQNKNNDN